IIRRPPRSTPLYSSAASDVYKRQALDIHGNREGGDMRGELLHKDIHDGNPPSQPQRSYTQVVAALFHLILKLRQTGHRVGRAQLTQNGLLGQQGRLLESTAHTHTYHQRGTGVGAGLADCVHHKINYALPPLRGLEHGNSTHVLRPATLGSQYDPHLVTRNDARVQDCRGVVTGVVAVRERLRYYGFAQISFLISLTHTLIDLSE